MKDNQIKIWCIYNNNINTYNNNINIYIDFNIDIYNNNRNAFRKSLDIHYKFC